MEASALTHASRRGLLGRRSPLLKLQGDQRLIAMARAGNAAAFETIVDRYQGRLLGFCRQMLGSTEDAEDVLQEVFVNAYRAMLADQREINLRPWLYRIARNRCLNQLRKPSAEAHESMDLVPAAEAASTAERVHNREEFRQLLTDVGKLPETQRSALLLREMDALSYEEIAEAMDTSVPSVKSLLVRARISLAEASQARQLTCGEVRLALAEAAEGLRKVSGPVRRHVRDCEECAGFRAQIRANEKALAELAPAGPLLVLKGFIASKLGLSGAGTGGGAAVGAGAGAGGAAVGSAGSVGAAIGGGAAGGIGAVGGALGAKAVVGVVTAAVLTAGAVEVKQTVTPDDQTAGITRVTGAHPHRYAHSYALAPLTKARAVGAKRHPDDAKPSNAPAAKAPKAAPEDPVKVEATPPATETPAQPTASGSGNLAGAAPGSAALNGASPSGGATGPTVVVVVGGAGQASPPAPPPAPAESVPPTTESPPPAAEPPAPPVPPDPASPPNTDGGSPPPPSGSPAPAP